MSSLFSMNSASISKKHEKRLSRWIIAACAILPPVFFISYIVYSSLSILGPWDRPWFENKAWSAFEIHYWLIEENNKKTARKFIISGEDLSKLKQLFSTKTVSGASTGSSSPLRLQLENGEQWIVDIISPNWLVFCLSSDHYYAYYVTLNDIIFVEQLREYCVKNERQYTPQVRIENINLCLGHRVIASEKLTEQQAKLFMTTDSRGDLLEVCVPMRAGVQEQHGVDYFLETQSANNKVEDESLTE